MRARSLTRGRLSRDILVMDIAVPGDDREWVMTDAQQREVVSLATELCAAWHQVTFTAELHADAVGGTEASRDPRAFREYFSAAVAQAIDQADTVQSFDGTFAGAAVRVHPASGMEIGVQGDAAVLLGAAFALVSESSLSRWVGPHCDFTFELATVSVSAEFWSPRSDLGVAARSAFAGERRHRGASRLWRTKDRDCVTVLISTAPGKSGGALTSEQRADVAALAATFAAAWNCGSFPVRGPADELAAWCASRGVPAYREEFEQLLAGAVDQSEALDHVSRGVATQAIPTTGLEITVQGNSATVLGAALAALGGATLEVTRDKRGRLRVSTEGMSVDIVRASRRSPRGKVATEAFAAEASAAPFIDGFDEDDAMDDEANTDDADDLSGADCTCERTAGWKTDGPVVLVNVTDSDAFCYRDTGEALWRIEGYTLVDDAYLVWTDGEVVRLTGEGNPIRPWLLKPSFREPSAQEHRECTATMHALLALHGAVPSEPTPAGAAAALVELQEPYRSIRASAPRRVTRWWRKAARGLRGSRYTP